MEAGSYRKYKVQSPPRHDTWEHMHEVGFSLKKLSEARAQTPGIL